MRQRSSNGGVIEALESRVLLSAIKVNTLADTSIAGDGKTSLREAIAQANSTTGADTILFDNDVFALDHTITLGGTQLQITDSVTITGLGAQNTIIDGNQLSRVFQVTGNGTNVTLERLTVTNGKTTAAGLAGSGAGIAFSAPGGVLTITDCTISNNAVTAVDANGGGLFYNANSTASISGSTFSGNSTSNTGFGAGLDFINGTITITNSTISGNSGGGGLNAESAASSLVLNHLTVTDNTAHQAGNAGGIRLVNSTAKLNNSIVAGNFNTAVNGAPDIFVSVAAVIPKFSLIGNNLGNRLKATEPLAPDADGNLIGEPTAVLDPVLGPLADNGGGTFTHSLSGFSPGLDRGSEALDTGLTTDQRGAKRIVGFVPDMGALEVQGELTVNLQVNPTTVKESNGDVSVTFNLRDIAASDVTIPFTFSGTALSPSDYTLLQTSPLVITKGTKFQTVKLFHLVDDTQVEGNETLILTLGNPIGGGIKRSPSNVVKFTITDNDPSANPVAFFTTSVQSVNETSPSGIGLQVNLSSAATADVSIPFTITAGSAGNGTDYTLSPASPLVITKGSTFGSILLTPLDDSTFEGDKTVAVTLGNPTGGNATLGTNVTQTVTILDDELPAPTVTFASTGETVEENDRNAINVKVKLSGPASSNVTIPFKLSGSALENDDYTLAPDTEVIIPKGQTETSIQVFVADDTKDENTETIVLTLGTPTGAGATLGATTVHTITINDNDTDNGGFFSFSPPSQTGVEGDTMMLALNRTGGSTGVASVDIDVDPSSTAIRDVDFAPSTTSLTFLDGETTKTFWVTLKKDGSIEPTETIVLKLNNPSPGAFIGTPDTTTINIQDGVVVNSPPRFTSDTQVKVFENSTAVMTVTATDPDQGQTVTYQITGGADASKFSITSAGVLTFKTAPDFEIPGDADLNDIYQVEVTADDNAGPTIHLTVTETITVIVANVVETPTLTVNSVPLTGVKKGKVVRVDDAALFSAGEITSLKGLILNVSSQSTTTDVTTGKDTLALAKGTFGTAAYSVSGGKLKVKTGSKSALIGLLSGGKSGQPLSITFNELATAVDVQNVVRLLTFKTTDKNAGIRNITLQLMNIGGQDIQPVSRSIEIFRV